MDFNNLEAVIAFGIEKEKEAADFYERNSETEMMSDKKQMLKDLAGEERKHQKMLCREEAKHKLALETPYDAYMAKMGG